MANATLWWNFKGFAASRSQRKTLMSIPLVEVDNIYMVMVCI
jgi:hypothetical protein